MADRGAESCVDSLSRKGSVRPGTEGAERLLLERLLVDVGCNDDGAIRSAYDRYLALRGSPSRWDRQHTISSPLCSFVECTMQKSRMKEVLLGRRRNLFRLSSFKLHLGRVR